MVAPNYFVKLSDTKAYSPANHTETVNRRIISPDTVGSKKLEILMGVATKGHGATRHMHPDIEQACYILEGRARAEVGGQSMDLGPGDACFFPAGEPHVFTVISDEPVKVLVIYSPPYMENPAQGISV